MRKADIVVGGVYARYNNVHRATRYRVIVAEGPPPTGWGQDDCDCVKYVQGGRKRDGSRMKLETRWCTRRAFATWAISRLESGATGIAADFGWDRPVDVRELAAKLAEEFGR